MEDESLVVFNNGCIYVARDKIRNYQKGQTESRETNNANMLCASVSSVERMRLLLITGCLVIDRNFHQHYEEY